MILVPCPISVRSSFHPSPYRYLRLFFTLSQFWSNEESAKNSTVMNSSTLVINYYLPPCASSKPSLIKSLTFVAYFCAASLSFMAFS